MLSGHSLYLKCLWGCCMTIWKLSVTISCLPLVSICQWENYTYSLIFLLPDGKNACLIKYKSLCCLSYKQYIITSDLLLNVRRILKFLIKMQKYIQLLSVHGCVDKEVMFRLSWGQSHLSVVGHITEKWNVLNLLYTYMRN
jgi:hypothetical protein